MSPGALLAMPNENTKFLPRQSDRYHNVYSCKLQRAAEVGIVAAFLKASRIHSFTRFCAFWGKTAGDHQGA